LASESEKTKELWGEFENSLLSGQGIDIGAGATAVLPNAQAFDVGDGDANRITEYVSKQFDFVFSSHCLEHMDDPRQAILQWWKLVKPGGVLFVIVPDEDLYEQGFWPSRFNQYHKWSFTISKQQSWSPVSINLLDLAGSLPGGRLLDIKLQDAGLQRYLLSNGSRPGGKAYNARRFLTHMLFSLLCNLRLVSRDMKKRHSFPVDQTGFPGVLAQIQCIVRKDAEAPAA
jgi:SAM-dependent methyltransferase